MSLPRLAALLVAEALLPAATLTLTGWGARRLGFGRADRITVVFAGSKKILAAGLPMAAVLFGAHAGLAVLPLMLFHQMQLMVCAVLARRWARRPENSVAWRDDPDHDAAGRREPRPPRPAPAGVGGR